MFVINVLHIYIWVIYGKDENGQENRTRKEKGSEKMKRERITKRVKELANGLVNEGIGYDWTYLKDKVLDENDNEYSYQEYEKAIQWIFKKLN